MTDTDWNQIAALSDDEVERQAKADPDNRPWTADDIRTAPRTPQVKIIRRALNLTQEDFARLYQIPLGTLRDWEQGRSQPDQTAKSYLTVIASDPRAVARIFEAKGVA